MHDGFCPAAPLVIQTWDSVTVDRRLPALAVISSAGPTSGYAAYLGIEARAFVLGGEPTSTWAEALLALGVRREIFHVIAAQGAGRALCVGWVVRGLGPTLADAAGEAAEALLGLTSLLPGDGALVTQLITSLSTLRTLFDPLTRPGIALRRAPVRARSSLDKPLSTTTTPSPWTGAETHWRGLLTGLAPAEAALVVRLVSAIPATANELHAVEDNVREATGLLSNAEGSAIRHGPLVDEAKEFAALAHARLQALGRGRGIRADVAVTCERSVSHELIALASAAFAPPSKGSPAAIVDFIAAGDLVADPALLDARHLVVHVAEAAALARTAETPTDERSSLPTSRARALPLLRCGPDGTPLGTSMMHRLETEVFLSMEARSRHAYVVGQTGTGKSTLLLSMIVNDIITGRGVTVIDPHGTLVEDVLARIPRERVDDVVIIDPDDTERAVGLNPLAIDEPDPSRYVARRDRVIDELLDTVKALFRGDPTMFGPMFEQGFRLSLTLMMGGRKPVDYTPILPMMDVVFTDEEVRNRLMERLRRDDPLAAATLRVVEEAKGDAGLANLAPYVTSKLNRFYAHAAARRILCQPASLDVREVLTKQRILLVPLIRTRVGPEASALIARQLVTQLVTAATTTKGVDHAIYVDEFHAFATEQFASLLAEARKFGLKLVLAHQHTGQLEERNGVLAAVLGNVGTMIVFRVGASDAGLLAPALGPPVNTMDLIGLPERRAVVRSTGALGGVAFTLATHAPPPAALSFEAVRAVRELARLKFGKDRGAIDAAIVHNLAVIRGVPGAAAA